MIVHDFFKHLITSDAFANFCLILSFIRHSKQEKKV